MTPNLYSIDLTGDELFTFVLDRSLDAYLAVDTIVVWLGLGLLALILFTAFFRGFEFPLRDRSRFEIDQAHFGVGTQRIILRPNETDRQIAYRIWVELSTRKIGLPVNLDDDVISELYDSWYNFFSVTRELVKDVPASKFRRKDTEQIVRLSIEVLNSGLRPHLTKWHARFRRWYEHALTQDENTNKSPQDVQKGFPNYDALKADLEHVNERLIHYRQKMYELVTSTS